MTAPIPISTSPGQPAPISNHNQAHPFSPPLPSNTPGSSISVSPQTPFLPVPSISSLGTSSTPTQTTGSGLFKWASSLGKSPNNANNMAFGTSPTKQQKGFEVPIIEDHEHEHDSFEFGDYNDLKSRSWNNSTGGRRTMSVSFESKSPNQNSTITTMLKGGFADSGGINAGGGGGAINQTQTLPSGVLADKAAKGQGVLRRLSLSGGSGYRPAFLSPPLPSAPLPSSPPTSSSVPSIPAPAPAPISAPAPPQAEPHLNRAVTVAGAPNSAIRGRRFSEGTKKRGVSPMGERLLRDHGHF